MNKTELKRLIEASLNAVDRNARENEYKGFDKYSLHNAVTLEGSGIVPRLSKRSYNFASNYFPGILLKILAPPKLIHAKAMGLFADAYLDMYRVTGSENYKLQAHNCMEWLLRNRSPEYPEYCWGVPFDWNSKGKKVPANTPIASVSSICVDPFWRWETLFQDHVYREIPMKTCAALLKSLYRHTDLPDSVACYGYTAKDQLRVLNGNLFLAEKLFLLGKFWDWQEGLEEGRKIVAYCLGNMNSDGTFPYQGREAGSAGKAVDAYHNGFILRSLFRINSLYPSEELYKALRSGLDAYLKCFVGPKGETWVQPGRTMVDIHGCAETILCLGRLTTLFPDCEEAWTRSIRWAIEHMQNRVSGHFFYRRAHFLSLMHWTVDVPYIRWSDAWMYKALAEALLILENGGVDW